MKQNWNEWLQELEVILQRKKEKEDLEYWVIIDH